MVALLAGHLTFARDVTPAEHVHALEAASLVHPTITFYSARRRGELLGVGALKELDGNDGELKSMHTRPTSRRQGVGRAVVEYIISVARQRGYQQLSLETGTGVAFEPAHRLYLGLGFTHCPPFGEYTANPYSTCMRIILDQRGSGRDASNGAVSVGDAGR